ncbi:MAG: hypothetical protein KAI66_08640 [Lentisphaeria bacterium]|nr:hypothetical protein [Lentisphaeria bacterium]
MKKLMMMMFCAAMVFAVVGCKEKTTSEKAADAIESAKEDAAAATKDAEKEAEAAKAEAAKKLDALKK